MHTTEVTIQAVIRALNNRGHIQDSQYVGTVTNLSDDLGMDSLDIAELCNDLEGNLSLDGIVSFSEDMKTVGDIVMAIEKLNQS